MIAVISASLGGIDKPVVHVPQTIPFKQFNFTDENLPPRTNALHPRLQAKIPKCFGWQLAPGFDYYLWLDGSLSMSSPDTLKYLFDQIQGYDLVLLNHPARPDIRQEVRYTRKGVNQKSIYMHSRYENEGYDELYDLIRQDKDYTDDLLVIGGCFLYRNTPEVQAMLKEWWYYQTRYCVQDQISFPYVLKKSGLKINVRPDNFMDTPYLKVHKHTKRNV